MWAPWRLNPVPASQCQPAPAGPAVLVAFETFPDGSGSFGFDVPSGAVVTMAPMPAGAAHAHRVRVQVPAAHWRPFLVSLCAAVLAKIRRAP